MEFPIHLFAFRSQRYLLSGRAITGGQSISGATQSVNTTGGGLWVFELAGARLRTAAQLKAWRAMEALIDDGVSSIIVPLCDYRQAPVPIVDGSPVYTSSSAVPHSDGAFFSDGTGYMGSGPGGMVSVGAALRATSLRLQMSAAGPLVGGEHFSLTHETAGRRLYRVRTVEADLGGGVYDVTIRPPLRDVVAAGAEADFRRPSCLMKVASPHEMAPTVEHLRFASGADVRFVEAFD